MGGTGFFFRLDGIVALYVLSGINGRKLGLDGQEEYVDFVGASVLS